MAMADADDISLAVDSQPKATSWLDVRVGAESHLSDESGELSQWI